MSVLERDQALLHLGWLMLAVPALLIPAGPTLGWRWAILLGLYHVMSVAVALQGRHHTWLRLWWFALVVGVVLAAAVALLAEGLRVVDLRDGLGSVLGLVGVEWLLLWSPVVVVAAAGAEAVGRRAGIRAAFVTAAAAGSLLQAALDAALVQLGMWRHADVLVAPGGWAVHLLPAGALLGVAALAGARWTRDESVWRTLLVAGVVGLAHTGAVAVGWLVVERVLAG